jgi:hypothetical protein
VRDADDCGIYPETAGYDRGVRGDTTYPGRVPTGQMTAGINAKTVVVGKVAGVGEDDATGSVQHDDALVGSTAD